MESKLRTYTQEEALALAKQCTTSSEVLDLIARDKEQEEEIKTFIARHPNTNSKTLVYLLKYDKIEMMGAIAEHPNTSPEILELMVKSSDKLYTQYKLAQNPNTPSEALEELADEIDDEHVRLAIAQNPNTSQSTLKTLFEDTSLIRIEAQKNYEEQEELSK